MARRRSPHTADPSTPDAQGGVPSPASHAWIRGGPPLPPPPAASLAARLRKALLGGSGGPNPFQSRSSSVGPKAALVCLAAAALVVVLAAPSGLLGPDAGGNFLRARRVRNDTDKMKRDESRDELLRALYGLPLPTTQGELEALNEEFADLDPELVLRWAHHQIPSPQLVQATSFGPTGLVVLRKLWEAGLLGDVPVVTMDTLHLFPESYEFYDTVRSYYRTLENGRGNKLDLTVAKPLRITYPPGMNGEGVLDGVLSSRAEFEAAYVPDLWKTDRQKFTKLTKVDPLERELAERGAKIWITGRRRSSGGERADMDVLEFEEVASSVPDRSSEDERAPFDLSRGRWKLNPLASWTYDQVWAYIRKHKLPYNTLYDKGYTSLGDVMTTSLPKLERTPGGGDAFERSGRFAGTGNNECGLHSHRQKVKAQKAASAAAGEELTAPALPCNKCVELTVHNFEEWITRGEEGASALLVEFYSPYCGGCQEFAPTVNRLADELSGHQPPTRVARFDITENEVPKIDGKEIFEVESTPTLYRVLYAPEFRAELYSGEHTFRNVRGWVTADPR